MSEEKLASAMAKLNAIRAEKSQVTEVKEDEAGQLILTISFWVLIHNDPPLHPVRFIETKMIDSEVATLGYPSEELALQSAANRGLDARALEVRFKGREKGSGQPRSSAPRVEPVYYTI